MAKIEMASAKMAKIMAKAAAKQYRRIGGNNEKAASMAK